MTPMVLSELLVSLYANIDALYNTAPKALTAWVHSTNTYESIEARTLINANSQDADKHSRQQWNWSLTHRSIHNRKYKITYQKMGL